MVSKWRMGCGTVWDMVVEGARGWMEGVFGGMGGEKIFAIHQNHYLKLLIHEIYEDYLPIDIDYDCNSKKNNIEEMFKFNNVNIENEYNQIVKEAKYNYDSQLQELNSKHEIYLKNFNNKFIENINNLNAFLIDQQKAKEIADIIQLDLLKYREEVDEQIELFNNN